MKKFLSYSLLAAAAAGVSFADTATTTPVGYVGIGNTTGPAVPANSDISISIPLEHPAEWTGTVASVAGNVITLSGAPGFTVNQWNNTAAPYIAKIEGGAESGLIALITANQAGSLTVSFQNQDNAAAVAANDKITIRKAWTLGTLFSGNTLPNNVEFHLFEGTAVGVNLAPDKIYYLFDGVWYDSADDNPSNSLVLYPNEAFKIRNNTSTPIASLVLAGQVPVANSRIFIKGGAVAQDTRFSYYSPVDEPIATSGLGANNDQLLVFSQTATGKDNAPSAIYYKFDNRWYDASDDTDVTDTLKLKAGLGYLFRTSPGSPSTTSKNTPDYVPSLQ
jgi:uncharacterized protein (TIGR02597 family)